MPKAEVWDSLTWMPFLKRWICVMHVFKVWLIYWISQKVIESIGVISAHWFIRWTTKTTKSIFWSAVFWAYIKKCFKQKWVSFSLIIVLNISFSKNKNSTKTTCVSNCLKQKESFPLLLDHYPYHNFLTWTLFSYFWQRILNERHSFVQN